MPAPGSKSGDCAQHSGGAQQRESALAWGPLAWGWGPKVSCCDTAAPSEPPRHSLPHHSARLLVVQLLVGQALGQQLLDEVGLGQRRLRQGGRGGAARQAGLLSQL